MSTNPHSQRFRVHTSLPFEVLISTFTLLPVLVLVYFYSQLPERIPEYLNLQGEVASWGQKSLASVFRLPLMAIDLQVLCLLTKYGSWQASFLRSTAETKELASQRIESFKLTARLMDWFRAFIAIKLGSSSVEVIFFSIERFHFLTATTRVISWVASIVGVGGGVFYGYRLFRLNQKTKAESADTKESRHTDKLHIHGGLFYYNPADPSWFTAEHLPNFGNKWMYVFVACLLFLPLLMFGPILFD